MGKYERWRDNIKLMRKLRKESPSNWIEGMSWELKRQHRKDTILRVFVWLILIPGGCVLSWYGIYKLISWIF